MAEEIQLEEFTTEGVEGDPLKTVLTAIVDEMEQMAAAIAALQEEQETLGAALTTLASQMVLLDHKINAGQ